MADTTRISIGETDEHQAIMTSTTPKKVRVPDLALMKQRGDRIVMLTAYDANKPAILPGRRLIPSLNDRRFEELKGAPVPVS